MRIAVGSMVGSPDGCCVSPHDFGTSSVTSDLPSAARHVVDLVLPKRRSTRLAARERRIVRIGSSRGSASLEVYVAPPGKARRGAELGFRPGATQVISRCRSRESPPVGGGAQSSTGLQDESGSKRSI